MADRVVRIAMWSGPRNISTAMMRAWENRPDTSVVDEPFYACYLQHSGQVHPMQEEILASQSADQAEVIHQLGEILPPGKQIQYQKHMTHHMLGELDMNWFASLRHAFLIRHPREVVASYQQKRKTINALDLGFKRQKELFELACQLGSTPPVIESSQVLQSPEQTLNKLCQALGVAFHRSMLKWPAGARDSDGVWASHWYEKVQRSTGFTPYHANTLRLDQYAEQVVDECLDDYLTLKAHCLQIL